MPRTPFDFGIGLDIGPEGLLGVGLDRIHCGKGGLLEFTVLAVHKVQQQVCSVGLFAGLDREEFGLLEGVVMLEYEAAELSIPVRAEKAASWRPHDLDRRPRRFDSAVASWAVVILLKMGNSLGFAELASISCSAHTFITELPQQRQCLGGRKFISQARHYGCPGCYRAFQHAGILRSPGWRSHSGKGR